MFSQPEDGFYSDAQLAALTEHDLIAGWVHNTLIDLPAAGDPWVELAPVVAVIRAALDETETMLHSSRMLIAQLGEISASGLAAGEISAIARTLERQVHLLGQLFHAGYEEQLAGYLALVRGFAEVAAGYEDALLGPEPPF